MHKKGLTFEMHHQRTDFARPGNTMELTSNVWNSMPRFGDVMAYKRSTTRGPNQGVRRSVSDACYTQQIKWLVANWLHAWQSRCPPHLHDHRSLVQYFMAALRAGLTKKAGVKRSPRKVIYICPAAGQSIN